MPTECSASGIDFRMAGARRVAVDFSTAARCHPTGASSTVFYGSVGSVEEIDRVVAQILAGWPRVKILLWYDPPRTSLFTSPRARTFEDRSRKFV
jgi:hypothetical protein